jgi:hypothetical protein
MYQTSLKPQARNYHATTRWDYDPSNEGLASSEDVVKQIVRVCNPNCSSLAQPRTGLRLAPRTRCVPKIVR